MRHESPTPIAILPLKNLRKVIEFLFMREEKHYLRISREK
jgi:hypothetical protein